MSKFKKILSAFLALWLCVLLVAFTYTWVSRNWTPSIKGDDIGIESSGALVISILGDESTVYDEVSLNKVCDLATDNPFIFRQVSSQDGLNFFWKDFSPTLEDKPSVFYKIEGSDTHKGDYIDTKFCLKLDDSLKQNKYIFIHPETKIEYTGTNSGNYDVSKAIRISLTYDKDIISESGKQTVTETVILGNIDDNDGLINAEDDPDNTNDAYKAVLSDANEKTDAENSGALGHQTVYGLHYFDCGRFLFNADKPFSPENYNFERDESKALFTLTPGEMKWVNMRIWLEGQDYNCEKEIAGEKFDLVLKFDSAYVE